MAHVYFRNVPSAIIDIKTRNEHTQPIFWTPHKVGVTSAAECSCINDRKKNDRKAELGGYFYRCFIIWFELVRILHLKDIQLYLNVAGIFNCK